jgi:hypothetical protein
MLRYAARGQHVTCSISVSPFEAECRKSSKNHLKSLARCRRIPPLRGPNGVDGVDSLGRVVTPERIERERSIEQKKRKHVEKLGGYRKSDHDLESGLVFLMSKRERIISLVHQHAAGAIQSNGLNHSLHKGPHRQQSSSINMSPA